ncbi:hypothetical protein HMPREF9225_0078 [Peptoniphilus duerdenii ATCC BAA-1640]|uniref:Uncharacterized protein n=1 Tax=Peptoniphilus duerdenii ATCC BAA-1640 TaxID=862517 RepID=E0NIT9_9FIRM|nr:hypothetical protein HMPREF9225_0078 [Peptoniphilus duerdenii ATCC BAA-1640]
MEADCFRYNAVARILPSEVIPVRLGNKFLTQGDGSWENILYKSTQRKTVTLSGDDGARRNRRSRMGITLVRSNTDDYLLPLQPQK